MIQMLFSSIRMGRAITEGKTEYLFFALEGSYHVSTGPGCLPIGKGSRESGTFCYTGIAVRPLRSLSVLPSIWWGMSGKAEERRACVEMPNSMSVVSLRINHFITMTLLIMPDAQYAK